MSILDVASVGTAGFGTAANAWLQVIGMVEGRKESRRTEERQIGLYERAEKTRQRERKEELGMQVDWQNFQKRQTFVDTVLGQMNEKPKLANNFIQAQRGRQ